MPKLHLCLKTQLKELLKKATSKGEGDYKEIIYEGYVLLTELLLFVETATDNNTRTVANVRSYFNKSGGSLGTSGSLSFLFDRNMLVSQKSASKEGLDLEETRA